MGLGRIDVRRAVRSSRSASPLVVSIVLPALFVGAALCVPSAPSIGTAHAAGVTEQGTAPIVLVADRDDDDGNGLPDGEEPVLAPAARGDLVPVDRAWIGAELRAPKGGDRLRMIAQGKPVAWGRRVPPGAALQGVAPGAAELVVLRGTTPTSVAVEVRGIGMRDENAQRVDLARDHASLERTPPIRIDGSADAKYDDPDALRLFIELPASAPDPAPGAFVLDSLSATGGKVDALAKIPLAAIPCSPPGAPAPSASPAPGATTGTPAVGELHCFASAPLRAVVDDVDRMHPLVQGRSLRAEIGGALVVREGGKKLQAIRVLGPRRSPAGPIARLKATLRPFVLRTAPGAAPSIGGNEAGAIAAVRAEVVLASATWGQCGLSFGAAAQVDVHVVNPPPAHLVALGDDVGLPASGGELRLRVEGHPLVVPTARGATPDRVAHELARAAERLGLVAIVSPNARIAPGALGSVDVSLRKKDGTLVAIEPQNATGPLCTDPSLVARIGTVDLSDGLQHFGDTDSVAGTLEERTLLKALDDGDPATIEVVVVPAFAGGGRIGESFIASDVSSLRNMVLLDRAGVRARRSSLTLAHELGHVFMDMPGHPDDFGIDTPTLLMDSDASDASPFGPRRLTLEECARVVHQSGPHARAPLLSEWRISGPIPR